MRPRVWVFGARHHHRGKIEDCHLWDADNIPSATKPMGSVPNNATHLACHFSRTKKMLRIGDDSQGNIDKTRFLQLWSRVGASDIQRSVIFFCLSSYFKSRDRLYMHKKHIYLLSSRKGERGLALPRQVCSLVPRLHPMLIYRLDIKKWSYYMEVARGYVFEKKHAPIW